jgi:intracellular sulfur oxidation DsrE/DsrF family protein
MPILGKGRVKVVYQLSEGIDQAVRAMANLRNHLNAAPDTKIVVVAFGYGIDFLVEGAKDSRGNTFEAPVAALASSGVGFAFATTRLLPATFPSRTC